MALQLKFDDQSPLAEARRHLDTANRCLVRQLRALSRLGRHTSELGLAEAVLQTMLQTHDLIANSTEKLEREFSPDVDANTKAARAVKPLRKRSSVEPDQQSTLILEKKKLRSNDSE